MTVIFIPVKRVITKKVTTVLENRENDHTTDQ